MTELENIIEALTTTSENLLIVAEAGAGKTTALLEIAKRLPPEKLSVALAFGTDIAAELGRRMPFWVQTATSHTYGKRLLERHLGAFKLRVDPAKCRKIAESLEPELYRYWSLTGKLVGLMKNFGYHLIDNAPNTVQIVEEFELYCDGDEEFAINLAMIVFHQSITEVKSVDFDDMLYLPLHRNVKFDPCDYVLVDEAQDLNAVQHELIARMVKPDVGRVIAVGDPRQAIFAFRGADHLSMEHLLDRFNMIVLPLSKSWRCSEAVVNEANEVWSSWNLPETLYANSR